MNNIVVTGGAGFIGSNLCKELLKGRNNIIVIDNLNNFYDPGIKLNNIQEIKSIAECNPMAAFSLHEGDIRDPDFLQKLFKTNHVDCIVHLAAYPGIQPSIENPILYTSVNIDGTLNMLEYARRFNIKQFIFASSSSVYGNSNDVPFKETNMADHPLSPYAATKKSAELLCHVYHKLYNINIACLRFFTVYGPAQRPDLAIHKFVKLILEDKDVPFYGDGTTERDYTYIDDIVNGIIKSIEWVQKSSNSYEIFNLANSCPVTLEKMVQTIEKTLGKKARLRILPLRQGDPDRTYGDITKAQQMLGYNPCIRFEKGIPKFIAWYKSQNNL